MVVAEKTNYFQLSLIEVLTDLQKSYNGDITLIDTILGVLSMPNDGASVTVDEPTVELDATSGSGGYLPPDTDLFYTYTFFDPANGLESAAAPEFSITTSGDSFPPDAPLLVGSGSGGDLLPGTYSYVLSYWNDFNTIETSALNASSVILHPADGNDQKITISFPSLDGATGFNIYRRRPGSSSYYFIGSQTGDADFVDDGLGPEDCERFAPVTSNLLSSYAVNVTIPSLPTGYHWKLYRSTTSGDFTNSLVTTVTDGSLTAVDGGFELSLRTPPAVTPVLVPGNVGLRAGHGVPSDSDGNDGDWWIDVDAGTLYGPKNAGTWPGGSYVLGGARSGLSIVTPTLETIDGDDYYVIDVTDLGVQTFGSVVSGIHGALLIRVPAANAATDQRFSLSLIGSLESDATVAVQWDDGSIHPQDMGSVVQYRTGGAISVEFISLPGALFGSPFDIWNPTLMAQLPAAIGAFTGTVAAAGTLPDPDCTVAYFETGSPATLFADINTYEFPQIKVPSFDLLQPFRVKLTNASALTKIRIVNAFDPGTYVDLTVDSLFIVDNEFNAIVRPGAPNPFFDAIVASAAPPEVGLIRVETTSGDLWLGTIAADTDISCAGREFSMSFLDAETWNISFTDINPGEYAEIGVNVYNGYGGGGGTLNPTFNGESIGRVNDIPDTYARRFKVYVKNIAGTITAYWDWGRTVPVGDPDY